MLDDVRLYPIHAFHELPRENVRRATLSTNMTLFKHHQLVTHARGQVDVMVGDLSFISIELVLPAIAECVREGGDLLPMVKPQFEVGKDRVGAGGVVRPGPCRAVIVAARPRCSQASAC